MKHRIYQHYSDPLKMNTCLFIGNSEQFFNYWQPMVEGEFDKEDIGLSDGAIYELRLKNNEYIRIMWLSRFNGSIYDHGLLVHEVTHLVLRTLRDKGIPVDIKNEELVAYYIEHFYKTYANKLKK